VSPVANPQVQILTHEFPPFTGGIGVYVKETAQALSESGGNCTVWAPDYGATPDEPFPFRVSRVSMRGKHDIVCRWRMGRAIGRAFPAGNIPGTVVLAEPGPILWWMGGRFPRPPAVDRLVLVLHGSEVAKFTRNPRTRDRFESILRQAERVGVVSKAVRQMLLSTYPEIESKVVIVPGAVGQAWLGEEAGFAGRRKCEVLQVGRIHPRKGQLFLLKALAKLPEEVAREWQVRFIGPVGKRSYAKELSRLAEKLSFDVRIDQQVNDTDLKKAYRRASLLVMPSQAYKHSVEGLGIALLEAQHFGCPVVGTRVGGIPEAIKEGKSGLIVEAGSEVALADAVHRLLKDKDLRTRMGSAGARFVREKFSWRRNVELLGLA
jgi:phosphatidylinositol alpha-1,6-mannosyltransferase